MQHESEGDGLALLREHGRKPHNMGRLGDADAVGNVGSIVVGRALRFFIRVAEDRITDARFQVFACPEMVASSSILTGMVIGRTLDEAAAIDAAAIAAEVGVDRFQLPLLPWGVEALADALRRYRGEAFDGASSGQRVAVCRCFGIDEVAIQAAIAEGAEDVEAIGAATRAGTGCGSCRREIAALLETATAEPAPATSGPGAGPAVTGRIQVMKRIEAATAAFGEEAAGLGGRLELWDFTGNELVVRIGGGALATDGAERRGLLERFDRELKDTVDPTLRLRVVELV